MDKLTCETKFWTGDDPPQVQPNATSGIVAIQYGSSIGGARILLTSVAQAVNLLNAARDAAMILERRTRVARRAALSGHDLPAGMIAEKAGETC